MSVSKLVVNLLDAWLRLVIIIFSDRSQWVCVCSEQQWHDNISSTIKNCGEYLNSGQAHHLRAFLRTTSNVWH